MREARNGTFISILALDPGKKLGWAVVHRRAWEDGEEESVVVASGTEFLEGVGTAERVDKMDAFIRDAAERHPFDLMAMEAPNIMAGSMEHRRLSFGLSTHAELMAFRWHMQFKLVSTMSLKKQAAIVLGEKLERKGKDQAIRAASRFRRVRDDNEADAVVIGLWAAERVAPNEVAV